MRLLMLSDGTFETQFGSFSELDRMPLVVGYSGFGAHPARARVDAGAATVGNPLAGTGNERVAGEEFGQDTPCDLGHVWARWRGYPERLDEPGPAPSILSAALKNRAKITMLAANSNILDGARLVVDGTEAFPLARSASGKKWVVGKRAVSIVSGLTVQRIWADGNSHTIAVVNPGGESSQPVSL
jgi:hypothetical protein